MIEPRTVLQSALAPVLKASGYLKKGLTWHRLLPETVLVFHARKNRWGADRYTFHPGVYLRAFGSETEPPAHRCHVQCLFEHLVPTWAKLEELSDFDTSYITEEDRVNGLRTLLTTYALPWLEQHSSTAAARQLAHLTYSQRLAQGTFMYEPTVRILATSSELADGAPPPVNSPGHG